MLAVICSIDEEASSAAAACSEAPCDISSEEALIAWLLDLCWASTPSLELDLSSNKPSTVVPKSCVKLSFESSALKSPETSCVILTGTGRGFCSGADTQHAEPPPNIAGLTLTRIATRAMTILADLVPAMQRMPQPVICAINGAAVGGGMCLTLGADIRLAGESAYFRAAGINNGLTATELGLSFLLPRAIGSSRAFEIMLVASKAVPSPP